MINKPSTSESKYPFFSFTGINGAGKTTLISKVEGQLSDEGYRVSVSKAYSDKIKEVTKPLLESADDVETMFVFQALHRRQRNNALARLAMGDVVLADRWDESFEAYHSQFGVLAGHDYLRSALKDLAFENLSPSITFYLQIDVSTALERAEERKPDKFDTEARSYDYQARHAEYYDMRARQDPSWIAIDANQSAEIVAEQTVQYIHTSSLLGYPTPS